MKDAAQKIFSDHLAVVRGQMDGEAGAVLTRIAGIVIQALHRGNKVIFFGNGGSAADSQHLAAELVGRFQKDRKALPAISLTVDTSCITALANDYSFDVVFERQLEALARPGDVSIGFSTSGGSRNVIRAQKKARQLGLSPVAFIGGKASALEGLCDVVYKVPSENTARVQESHILAGHILCQLVEEALARDEK
jgi:D-sedoheptulose 7-phosphate isomerase